MPELVNLKRSNSPLAGGVGFLSSRPRSILTLVGSNGGMVASELANALSTMWMTGVWYLSA